MAPGLVDGGSSCRAAIFAAVGVLNGSKFKGGRRRGWRFLLPVCELVTGFLSASMLSPIVRPFLCLVSLSVLEGSRWGATFGTQSGVELSWGLVVSKCWLDLREDEKYGPSKSCFGES